MSLLPTEILDLVLACLRDDTDALRACSLVSSEFLPISRRFLFGHIFLLPEPRQPAPRSCSLAMRTSSITQGPRSESLSPCVPASRSSPVAQKNLKSEVYNENACTKLVRLLSMSPSMAHYIQRVTVVDGRLFPSQDPPFRNDSLFTGLGLDNAQSSQYFKIRDKLNGPQWFLSISPRILYSLFQKLQIRAFDLVFQDGPRVRWNDIPRDVRGALNYLFTSPSFDTLELRRVSWDTPTTLREFTSTLSQGSIKHLTLRDAKLLSTTPSPDQKYSSSPRPCDRSHSEHSGPHRNQIYRTRGRSPTPRSDSPPFHALQAQAQTHDRHNTHTYPTPLPSAKPTYSRQIQNQLFPMPPSSNLSPYTYTFDPTSLPHDYHNQKVDDDSESDETLCLDSLAITGRPSPQDPDASSATLDLLRTLLLSQPSLSIPRSNLHPHRSGNRLPTNSTSESEHSSIIHGYGPSHTLSDFASIEGPSVNPFTLRRLSIPDVGLEQLPKVIDILAQCEAITTGLEELTLSDRLSGSLTQLFLTSPNSRRVASEISFASILDFSIFQNLRTLKLGAYIPPTFNAHTTTSHRFPSASAISSPLSKALPSSAEYPPVGHLSWLSQALHTLPQSLETLSIQFAIDTPVHEHELRHILDQLSTIRGRRPRMQINVSKSVPLHQSGFGSMPSSMLGSGNGDGGYRKLSGRGERRAVFGQVTILK